MGFPREIDYETSGGRMRYVLDKDVIALRGLDPGQGPVEGEVERLAPDMALCHRTACQRLPKAQAAMAAPVYRLDTGGPVAVPTGSVYVRLAAREDLESRRDELADVGFELERVSPAMRHVGWVRAASGRLEDALRKLPKLERLRAVEAVEPEMLMQRQRKAPSGSRRVSARRTPRSRRR